MKVFILQHEHASGEADDVKIIGIYDTAQAAEQARDRYGELPGFREARDGFTIDSYELNVGHWAEGFATIAPAKSTKAMSSKAKTAFKGPVRRPDRKAGLPARKAGRA